jgi:hypothetical protein
VTVAGGCCEAYGLTISKTGMGGLRTDSGRYETELRLMGGDERLPFSRAIGRRPLQYYPVAAAYHLNLAQMHLYHQFPDRHLPNPHIHNPKYYKIPLEGKQQTTEAMLKRTATETSPSEQKPKVIQYLRSHRRLQQGILCPNRSILYSVPRNTALFVPKNAVA